MPIRTMEEKAAKITTGDFSTKLDIDRKDELGALAQALNEMSKNLEKNIKGKMRLMADISHELRTPLATIQGCSESLIDGVVEDEEEKKEYLQNIIAQTRKLSLLIDDLMELSRFESGEIKVEKKPFPPGEIIKRAIQSASLLARKKGITLESSIPDEKIMVSGDPDRMLQAIQNLVNNSVIHSPQGTLVQVSARQQGKEVVFSVKDNGPGIPEEHLGYIFDRFYKVDRARTSKDASTGSGLGLAIVSEIIKAHNSSVMVKSSPRGTNFYFSLPIADVSTTS